MKFVWYTQQCLMGNDIHWANTVAQKTKT